MPRHIARNIAKRQTKNYNSHKQLIGVTMAMTEKHTVQSIRVKNSPTKKPIQRLPWPRMADDGVTPVGIDVKEKRQDIIKLTYKYFRVSHISMDELLQEIYLAIIHKNHSGSAHDPRKSSFGHYVCMVANNICINLVNRRKRLDREKESIDVQLSDNKSFLDVYEDENTEIEIDSFNDDIEYLESKLRMDGHWEIARYIKAVRSGSKPDVIREALTWGNRKITTKYVRGLRESMKSTLSNYMDL